MVSPQPGQPVGIHYAKYFGFLVFPSDEIFVPAVRKQLINIIPKQPTVCEERSKAILTFYLGINSGNFLVDVQWKDSWDHSWNSCCNVKGKRLGWFRLMFAKCTRIHSCFWWVLVLLTLTEHLYHIKRCVRWPADLSCVFIVALMPINLPLLTLILLLAVSAKKSRILQPALPAWGCPFLW